MFSIFILLIVIGDKICCLLYNILISIHASFCRNLPIWPAFEMSMSNLMNRLVLFYNVKCSCCVILVLDRVFVCCLNCVQVTLTLLLLLRFVWKVLSSICMLIVTNNLAKGHNFGYILLNDHVPKASECVVLWTLCSNDQTKRFTLALFMKSWFDKTCINIVLFSTVFQL